jgi:hypothetical protein
MKGSDNPGENPRLPRFAVTSGIVFVLLIVAALWAYISISLPFETFTKYRTRDDYKISAPALLVFASKSDVLQPVPGLQYPVAISEPLMAVDYQHSIAILVLRGYGNISSPDVRILWVGHQGKRVIVLTEFENPSPWQGIPPYMGSPYQIILIPRDNLEGELRFSLIVGLREVAATTRRLP